VGGLTRARVGTEGGARRPLTRVVERVRSDPFFALLPLQAALLLWRLDRLPPWDDEEVTRLVATAPWAEAMQVLRHDNHPPLYFWLARAWLTLPWRVDPIIALRALSALLALLGGVIVYAVWVRHQSRPVRWWFAALWVTSPYLLLYARMARGYTLQIVLGALALAAAERLLREPRRPGPLFAYSAAATVSLYTHYLPAAALISAVGALLLWRLARERRAALLVALLVPPAAIAAAFAPWVAHLAMVSERFAVKVPYTLSTNPLLEHVVEVGYALVSFTDGESLAAWVLPLAALATLAALVLAVGGAATRPPWLALVALAAAIGFAATSRWVSYAFIAARLTFVYPFWLLLLALGIARRPALGRAGGAVLLAVALAAIASYVRVEGFLNKAYVIPADAIAADIAARSSAADTLVLIDPAGANINTTLRRLLPRWPAIVLYGRVDEAQTRALAPGTRTVWLVRSAVDRSPGRYVSGLEAALAEHYERRVHELVPYSAFDRLAMRAAGWPVQPSHVIDVVELRRRE
jgi:uncharacterized membrane protein